MDFTILDRSSDLLEQWDTTLCDASPYSHILQSHTWGQFKSSNSWQPLYILGTDNQHNWPILGLTRSIPLLGKLLYFPKGPVLQGQKFSRENSSDVKSFHVKTFDYMTDFLDFIEQTASKLSFHKVKIELEAPKTAVDLDKLLKSRNFSPSSSHPQFKRTMFIDLDLPEDEIMAGFKQKTRYNIRLSHKKGVLIKSSEDSSSYRAFYDLYSQTGKRGHFPVRPWPYYEQMWSQLSTQGYSQLFLAYPPEDSSPCAGILLYKFGNRAYYQFGASKPEHNKLMPNYLLQWHAMKWAKTQGCDLYDMVGLPEQLDENDPFYGVWRFKRGFSGREVDFLGSYDWYSSPFKQKMWNRGESLYKRWLWYSNKQVFY